MKKKLLIPIDFTPTANSSFLYGLEFAAKNSFQVILLHIIDDEDGQLPALKKLNAFVDSIKNTEKISVEQVVEVGNLKQDISRIAEKFSVELILMGIHQATGLRKVFGSKAVDVIATSTIPFLTLQTNTKYKDIKNIALTFDVEKESIQIIKSVVSLFKDSIQNVSLIIGKQTDEEYKLKMTSQLVVVKRFLAKNNIAANVVLLQPKDFLESLVEHCAMNDIQILGVTYYQNTFNVFSAKFVQHLIENKLQIPILTTSGVPVSGGSQYSFMTG